jgi:hypothetical protein
MRYHTAFVSVSKLLPMCLGVVLKGDGDHSEVMAEKVSEWVEGVIEEMGCQYGKEARD